MASAAIRTGGAFAMFLVVALFGGCGSDEITSERASEPPSIGEEVARRYVLALSAADYREACGLLTNDLRSQFDAVSRSCERGLDEEGPIGDQYAFDEPLAVRRLPGHRDIVPSPDKAEIEKYRIADGDGERAEVTVRVRGQRARIALTLHTLEISDPRSPEDRGRSAVRLRRFRHQTDLCFKPLELQLKAGELLFPLPDDPESSAKFARQAVRNTFTPNLRHEIRHAERLAPYGLRHDVRALTATMRVGLRAVRADADELLGRAPAFERSRRVADRLHLDRC